MIRTVPLDMWTLTSQSVADSTELRAPLLVPRQGAAIRSLELDCRNNLTFYYDPIRRVLFQNKFDPAQPESEGQTTVLIPDNLNYVENLAYDWIGTTNSQFV